MSDRTDPFEAAAKAYDSTLVRAYKSGRDSDMTTGLHDDALRAAVAAGIAVELERLADEWVTEEPQASTYDAHARFFARELSHRAAELRGEA